MSEIKYFTYDEIKELLKIPMPWRTRALFAFQYASGARIGELIPYTHIMSKEVSLGLQKSNIKINQDE
ncbi:hypothetical protein LCGC14_2888540, partial [marine sediment metagenome]